jgi:hypothetical protein
MHNALAISSLSSRIFGRIYHKLELHVVDHFLVFKKIYIYLIITLKKELAIDGVKRNFKRIFLKKEKRSVFLHKRKVALEVLPCFEMPRHKGPSQWFFHAQHSCYHPLCTGTSRHGRAYRATTPCLIVFFALNRPLFSFFHGE